MNTVIVPTNGSTDATPDINTIVTTYGTNDTLLVFDGIYAIKSTVSVPKNFIIQIEKGSVFIIDSGITLTLYGKIDTFTQVIFEGDGNLRAGSDSFDKLKLEYFPIKFGTVTDADRISNRKHMGRAIATAHFSNTPLFIPGKTTQLYISDYVPGHILPAMFDVSNDLHVIGSGTENSIIQFMDATGPIENYYFLARKNILFENIQFKGPDLGYVKKSITYSTTSGSPVLTTVEPIWTALDYGKTIYLLGGGASGEDIQLIIDAVTNSNTIVLKTNAPATRNNLAGYTYTSFNNDTLVYCDNTNALTATINYSKNSTSIKSAAGVFTNEYEGGVFEISYGVAGSKKFECKIQTYVSPNEMLLSRQVPDDANFNVTDTAVKIYKRNYAIFKNVKITGKFKRILYAEASSGACDYIFDSCILTGIELVNCRSTSNYCNLKFIKTRIEGVGYNQNGDGSNQEPYTDGVPGATGAGNIAYLARTTNLLIDNCVVDNIAGYGFYSGGAGSGSNSQNRMQIINSYFGPNVYDYAFNLLNNGYTEISNCIFKSRARFYGSDINITNCSFEHERNHATGSTDIVSLFGMPNDRGAVKIANTLFSTKVGTQVYISFGANIDSHLKMENVHFISASDPNQNLSAALEVLYLENKGFNSLSNVTFKNTSSQYTRLVRLSGNWVRSAFSNCVFDSTANIPSVDAQIISAASNEILMDQCLHTNSVSNMLQRFGGAGSIQKGFSLIECDSRGLVNATTVGFPLATEFYNIKLKNTVQSTLFNIVDTNIAIKSANLKNVRLDCYGRAVKIQDTSGFGFLEYIHFFNSLGEVRAINANVERLDIYFMNDIELRKTLNGNIGFTEFFKQGEMVSLTFDFYTACWRRIADSSQRNYFQQISANYSATLFDNIIYVNASTGAITVTLPSASAAKGKILTIKKIDSSMNNVVIDGNGSDIVEFALTQVLASQGEYNKVQSNGTEWFKI